MTWLRFALLCGLMTGCERVVPPYMSGSGGPGPTVGAGDGATDAALDGDAPQTEVRVDGVESPDEWNGTSIAIGGVSTSNTTYAGNQLISVRAFKTNTDLYVAVEAELLSQNTIALWLDVDVNSENGRTLFGTGLDDNEGQLDSALSAPLLSALPEFRPEFGWGVSMLPQPSIQNSDGAGWRDIRLPNFTTMVGSTTACSMTFCETRITMAALRADPNERFAIAVRLGNGLTWSNQTLPEDQPQQADTINNILAVTFRQ